jgi:hypothetical protein
MSLFEKDGMQWPPVTLPIQDIKEFTCFFGGMTVRQLELTVLLHSHYPPDPARDVEFMDARGNLLVYHAWPPNALAVTNAVVSRANPLGRSNAAMPAASGFPLGHDGRDSSRRSGHHDVFQVSL